MYLLFYDHETNQNVSLDIFGLEVNKRLCLVRITRKHTLSAAHCISSK